MTHLNYKGNVLEVLYVDVTVESFITMDLILKCFKQFDLSVNVSRNLYTSCDEQQIISTAPSSVGTCPCGAGEGAGRGGCHGLHLNSNK